MKNISLMINETEYKILKEFNMVLNKKKHVNMQIAIHELYNEFKEKGEYYMKNTMIINIIQILIDDIVMENRKRNKLNKLLELMEEEFEYLYDNINEETKAKLKDKIKQDKNPEIMDLDDTPSLF